MATLFHQQQHQKNSAKSSNATSNNSSSSNATAGTAVATATALAQTPTGGVQVVSATTANHLTLKKLPNGSTVLVQSNPNAGGGAGGGIVTGIPLHTSNGQQILVANSVHDLHTVNNHNHLQFQPQQQHPQLQMQNHHGPGTIFLTDPQTAINGFSGTTTTALPTKFVLPSTMQQQQQGVGGIGGQQQPNQGPQIIQLGGNQQLVSSSTVPGGFQIVTTANGQAQLVQTANSINSNNKTTTTLTKGPLLNGHHQQKIISINGSHLPALQFLNGATVATTTHNANATNTTTGPQLVAANGSIVRIVPAGTLTGNIHSTTTANANATTTNATGLTLVGSGAGGQQVYQMMGANGQIMTLIKKQQVTTTGGSGQPARIISATGTTTGLTQQQLNNKMVQQQLASGHLVRGVSASAGTIILENNSSSKSAVVTQANRISSTVGGMTVVTTGGAVAQNNNNHILNSNSNSNSSNNNMNSSSSNRTNNNINNQVGLQGTRTVLHSTTTTPTTQQTLQMNQNQSNNSNNRGLFMNHTTATNHHSTTTINNTTTTANHHHNHPHHQSNDLQNTAPVATTMTTTTNNNNNNGLKVMQQQQQQNHPQTTAAAAVMTTHAASTESVQPKASAGEQQSQQGMHPMMEVQRTNPVENNSSAETAPGNNQDQQQEEDGGQQPVADENAEDDGDAPEIDIVINNVVCSFGVRCHLNLREIALNGHNVEFRRENGMVTMKLRKPYTTASMWSSGKITCTGATSEDHAKIAARRYSRCLQKLGFKTRLHNFRIVNVLGTCHMPWDIKITNFSERHRQDASYEPELHPGVTYKLKEPKATLKIFSTGSVTVTAGSVSHVQEAIEFIFPLLYEFRKERAKEVVVDKSPTAVADGIDSSDDEDVFGGDSDGDNVTKSGRLKEDSFWSDEDDNGKSLSGQSYLTGGTAMAKKRRLEGKAASFGGSGGGGGGSKAKKMGRFAKNSKPHRRRRPLGKASNDPDEDVMGISDDPDNF